MSNRYMQQFSGSLDHAVTHVHGYVVIGASGAVTSFKGLGISGVTKTATGVYTIAIQDSYPGMLGASAMVAYNGTSVVGNVAIKQDLATDPGVAKSLVLNTLDFAGADVSPQSGSRIYFHIIMRNSSYVPPGGV